MKLISMRCGKYLYADHDEVESPDREPRDRNSLWNYAKVLSIIVPIRGYTEARNKIYRCEEKCHT
ncbi:hypothetical protein G9C98_005383 [Cotesia typhae]|uniref:Uncharacterized protein n=1 Tax=Cotesia typhae TaxID=2053667 RepID=A0A8J5RB74_9HYME|nr:hypothetical protein G9C98_005383 [Cotesia typhae]